MITKPYRGLPLDITHPLGDMRACWVLNEGTGSKIRDYAGAHYGNADGAGGVPDWEMGMPVFDNTANKYYSIQNHEELFTDYSSLFFILCDISTVNNSGMFCHQTLNNTDGYYLLQKPSGRVSLFSFDGTSVSEIEWKYFPSWNADRRFLCIELNNIDDTAALWVDGKHWTEQGAWVADVRTTPTGLCRLGATNYGGAADLKIECCYIYPRLLNDHENMALYQNPYQMFRGGMYWLVEEAGGVIMPIFSETGIHSTII